jgi:hypothetical protein
VVETVLDGVWLLQIYQSPVSKDTWRNVSYL